MFTPNDLARRHGLGRGFAGRLPPIGEHDNPRHPLALHILQYRRQRVDDLRAIALGLQPLQGGNGIVHRRAGRLRRRRGFGIARNRQSPRFAFAPRLKSYIRRSCTDAEPAKQLTIRTGQKIDHRIQPAAGLSVRREIASGTFMLRLSSIKNRQDRWLAPLLPQRQHRPIEQQ